MTDKHDNKRRETTELRAALLTGGPTGHTGSHAPTGAPLPDVLRTLSSFYGVELTASDTTKRLTGDLDTTSLQRNIDIIEQVLDVSIKER